MAKKKPITLTRAKIEKLKEEVTWDVMVLFVATCMDEFGWTDDDVEAFAVRLERYAGAVNDHLITIEHVRRIIKDTIGTVIR